MHEFPRSSQCRFDSRPVGAANRSSGGRFQSESRSAWLDGARFGQGRRGAIYLCGARLSALREQAGRQAHDLVQRLRQLAKDPQSTWEDPDLARCFGDLRRGTSKLEAVRKEKRSTKDHD